MIPPMIMTGVMYSLKMTMMLVESLDFSEETVMVSFVAELSVVSDGKDEFIADLRLPVPNVVWRMETVRCSAFDEPQCCFLHVSQSGRLFASFQLNENLHNAPHPPATFLIGYRLFPLKSWFHFIKYLQFSKSVHAWAFVAMPTLKFAAGVNKGTSTLEMILACRDLHPPRTSQIREQRELKLSNPLLCAQKLIFSVQEPRVSPVIQRKETDQGEIKVGHEMRTGVFSDFSASGAQELRFCQKRYAIKKLKFLTKVSFRLKN